MLHSFSFPIFDMHLASRPAPPYAKLHCLTATCISLFVFAYSTKDLHSYHGRRL